MKDYLSKHKKWHEGQKFYCGKCDKSIDENYQRTHKEWHDMKEEGLMFHCKECNTSYTMKANFFRHIGNVHAGKKIEPVIVLGESDSEALTQNKNSNPKEENENPKSIRSNVLPKPKKGMWIVKLKKLKT